jgi:hypothetical protein
VEFGTKVDCEKKVLPELRFVVSDTTQKEAIGCPRCKTAMQEVARIKPSSKRRGLSPTLVLPADVRSAKFCPPADVGVKNNLAHRHARPD